MIGRLGIDDVHPRIRCGEVPAKAVVGEVIPLSALIWREGHDAINATAVIKPPKDSGQPIQRIPMVKGDDPDWMHATFVPDTHLGEWTFRIDAWSDPYSTWRHAIVAKVEAGNSADDIANECEVGARIFDRATDVCAPADRQTCQAIAAELRSTIDIRSRISRALSAEVVDMMRRHPVRDLLTRSRTHTIKVERRRALVGAWYELFPRSTGGVDDDGTPVHGTFTTAAKELDRIAQMGFDVVYLPPIHPIGTTNRKGRNNTLTPEPTDVGSPWAIGSQDGGHEAIHPELGTVDDFAAFTQRAHELKLEVALDLALQCSPDHPWAVEHPEWFTTLPDGTIAYAENPPKKYQDIYPLNFDNDPDGIYQEVLRIVKLWISRGVTIFRVDNPHTKPTNFWAWLISAVHDTNPEVIFLAEAFTRRPRLYGLAKAGFSQSYTYFTWQTTKTELTAFGREIATAADVSRPNLFVNTPDILHASLQEGGRAMFAIRAALAATMAPTWGMYSGFELYEHQPVAPGSEEYLDSEKYQLVPRDYATAVEQGNSLEPYISLLNRIRRSQPALQQLRTFIPLNTDNDDLLAYAKVDSETGNCIVTVVTLEPRDVREGTVYIDLARFGYPEAPLQVRDLISNQEWTWSHANYVRLDPTFCTAHIVQLPDVSPAAAQRLSFRDEYDYRYSC